MDAEVIIVGAGPAGSTLARLLAEAGREVLLLDKATFPRPKTCGGGITPPAKALLPPLTGVWRGELRRLTFRYRGADSLTITSATPLTYLVDRPSFDAALLAGAELAGAQVRTGVTLKAATADEGGVNLETDLGLFRGHLAVGADGALGRFGPALGLGGSRPGLALEAEIPLARPQITGEGIIDYGFGSPGYGWLFPKEGLSSVGLGSYALGGKHLKEEFHSFLASLGLSLAASHSLRGHPIPVAGTGGPLIRPRAAVIGDAAGLADPLSGEGIRYALLSAHFLAETILSPKAAQGDLTAYQTLVEERILRNLRAASRLSRLFFPVSPRLHRHLAAHPSSGERLGGLVSAWLQEEIAYGDFFKSFRSLLWRTVGRKLKGAIG